MPHQWSLKAKLISLCLGIASLSALVGTVGVYTTKDIVQALKTSTAKQAEGTALARMRSEYRKRRIHLTLLGFSGQSAADIEDNLKGIATAQERYEMFSKEYERTKPEGEEKELYNTILAREAETTKMIAEVLRIAHSSNEMDRARIRTILTVDMKRAADQINAPVSELIDLLTKKAEAVTAAADRAESRGLALNVGLSLAAFAFALVIGVIFSTALSRPLQGLASRLSGGATEVASSSREIAAAGAQLSASSTEQAAALQETVASIDEVSAMVSKNADNAKRSLVVAEHTQESAKKGREAVNQMLLSIESINRSNADIMSQTAASNTEIGHIVKVISEISQKTKVINDIVFQTKLLSFNASVEAARAGEHGKGFAVVAEEVGNLAQMSGNAAKEISEMLEESMKKVEDIVISSKTKIERLIVTGKERIEDGLVTARRCGDSLGEIVRDVEELGHMVNEIANASHEQALGVQEITKAMGQLDQVTQQNAASSQQAANASDNLKNLARSLHLSIGLLVQTVEGGAARQGAEPYQNATPEHLRTEVAALAHSE